MDNTLLIVLLAIAVIVIAVGAWFYYQRTTSKRLKERFGPEYDRTVERLDNRDVAEKELRDREARVTRFKIVPLSREDSQRYRDKWTGVQAQFVDEPKVAVSEANFLIQEVMRKRGYPVSDFEQSAADLSVEHPVVVENYRTANAVAERNKRGAADTEELRRAFVSYRALFEDLLDTGLADSGRRQPEVTKPSFGRKSNNRKGMHP
jgi:FtsZ-interacting cell division protein ZipA